MSSPPPPPPPPPNPTTTTTAATADFLKSMANQKPTKQHSHPSIYYNPQHPFPPPTQPTSRSIHQQQPPAGAPFQPNSGSSFPPRPVSGYHNPYAVNRPHGFSNSDQLVNTHLQQTLIGGGLIVGSGSAHPKVVGQSSVADKNGDDAFVVIRDRKVQVSEGTSLYAQSRSWLKNGQAFEKQPQQYPDCVKSLPKPLPASKVEATKEDDMEIDEMPENVDHLSVKELLQLHIDRAKKVRARKRNERLQKIERYKDRLALLLPPVAEEKPKNDPAS
ncbi:uncharacterized protein LOC143583681 [Bidens hawaiensis]|uniref:uncharacterized protein LOC143583681 n=1 Tax=Bidens hawaiensis TaxID=980011 RepID=UPI00404A416A